MTQRDAIARRLGEHRVVATADDRRCACGDWTSRSRDSFEQHQADVVLFYVAPLDHSAERWDEGYVQAVIDLCPSQLTRAEKLWWTLEHPPTANPYRA